MQDTRQIFIRNLRVEASIGVYEHEKRAKQPLVVTIILTIPKELSDWGAVHTPERAEDDPELRKVLCYAVLSKRVIDLLTEAHIDLLETAADAILALCLKDRRVKAAEVSLEKPEAVPEAEAVGVRVWGRQQSGNPEA